MTMNYNFTSHLPLPHNNQSLTLFVIVPNEKKLRRRHPSHCIEFIWVFRASGFLLLKQTVTQPFMQITFDHLPSMQICSLSRRPGKMRGNVYIVNAPLFTFSSKSLCNLFLLNKVSLGFNNALSESRSIEFNNVLVHLRSQTVFAYFCLPRHYN